MFGRVPKFPLDLINPDCEVDQDSADVTVIELNPKQFAVERYLEELRAAVNEFFEQVQINRDCKLDKAKILNDRNIKPLS